MLRRLGLVATVLVCLALVGCSTHRTQMERALRMEQAGDWEHAFIIYDRLVPQIPEDRPAELSQGFTGLGRVLIKLQRYPDAASTLQRAAELDPENLEARQLLGELYVAAGLFNRAREMGYYIISQRAGDLDAMGLLGAAAAGASEYREAESLYQAVLKQQPSNTKAAIALAELRYKQDKTQDARAVLENAGKSANHPAPWLALGRLEEQEGNSDAAEAAYRNAIQADGSPETRNRFAQFLAREARTDEAESVLRPDGKPSAVAAEFSSSAGKPERAVRDYYLLWRDAQAMEKARFGARLIETVLAASGNEQAGRLLQQLRSDLQPSDASALNAELALQEGDVKRALSEAQSAIDRDRNSAWAHYVYGTVLDRAERRGDAIVELTSALQIDPHHIPSRVLLAELRLESGDLENADDLIASVVREEPANTAALNVYARVLLAQGKSESARAISTRHMMVAPDGPQAHVNLGHIALSEGRLALALVEFRKGILRDPNSEEALEGLVAVYGKAHITPTMVKKMERIASAPPVSAELLEVAGRLYHALGESKPAERALAAASEARKSRADMAARQKRQPSEIESNNLAWDYAEHGGSLERALELAQDAARRSPRDGRIVDTLGYVYLKRREFSAAVAAFEKAASLVPRDSADYRAILGHLQAAYAASGLTPKP